MMYPFGIFLLGLNGLSALFHLYQFIAEGRPTALMFLVICTFYVCVLTSLLKELRRIIL